MEKVAGGVGWIEKQGERGGVFVFDGAACPFHSLAIIILVWLKEMDQEKSSNEMISLQDRSRYSDNGSLTKLWVFESGDFEEEEAYILQTGFKDDHEVDLNYLIELGLSKNEAIIGPEVVTKQYQGLEYEKFKDN